MAGLGLQHMMNLSLCALFDVPALWGDCLVALVVLLIYANVFQAVLVEQHFQTK